VLPYSAKKKFFVVVIFATCRYDLLEDYDGIFYFLFLYRAVKAHKISIFPFQMTQESIPEDAETILS